MKNSVLICYLLISTSFINPAEQVKDILPSSATSENVFIITIDGFRWQEVFNGADSALINNEDYTPDTATLKSMYWASTGSERRKLLMPFFWNVIAKNGQLLGNRELNNKMNVSNLYSVSYPGYNEIFTGTTDITISGNSKRINKNVNVLEYLNTTKSFKDKIAVFSSWDVFPYILNERRNGLPINSGYEESESENETMGMINAVHQKAIEQKTATRYDMLTYSTAKEYIKNHRPKIVVIGFGETDDYAHQKRYDLYLQQANQVDRMISELWHFAQTTPGYKNNTSFLITTDHGRGSNPKHWSGHSFFINGSSQTWLALMGPSIEPSGEQINEQQVYTRQLASTIAQLAGEEFIPGTTSISFTKK